MERHGTAIVVVNWNGYADTVACLESIYRLESDAFTVIVCDNASSDNSAARLRKWSEHRLTPINAARRAQGLGPARFTLIETGANLGYAGGNNVGLRHALGLGYASFWLLNNDCEVEPDALHHVRARTGQDDSIGLCGSTLVYASAPNRIQTMGGGSFDPLKGRAASIGWRADPSEPIDGAAVEAQLRFINGASVFVTRAFIEAAGLMEEDYFLYWEELDWATRAGPRFKLGYAPASIVRHKVGASIGTSDFGEGSSLSAYYLTRNRLKFCWRHSPVSLPFVYADVARSIVTRCISGHWARALLLARAALGIEPTQKVTALARRGPWQAKNSRSSASSSTS